MPIDTLLIKRVANGWVLSPGTGAVTEFCHIAATPSAVADHVKAWAAAQIDQDNRLVKP